MDRYIWHVAHRERSSPWEAAYINGIIDWVAVETGETYRSILDVPCGNARLHPYLRKYGYDVYGFDASEELVQEAKERNRNVWVGDMRDPDAYRGKYDVVLNWYTSFGYFDDETNERVVENFARALRGGGILVIDVPLPGAPPLTGARRWAEDIVEVMEEEAEDEKHRRLRLRLFREEGNVLRLLKEVRLTLRVYDPDEMRALLERHGFRLLHVLGRYTYHSPRPCREFGAVYVAVKTRD